MLDAKEQMKRARSQGDDRAIPDQISPVFRLVIHAQLHELSQIHFRESAFLPALRYSQCVCQPS
ncbi:MAG: hypothetical protein CMM07_15525 [Rhodopirellula sp.]|nr:hypothetical protein [Rhodopirellula sp.]